MTASDSSSSVISRGLDQATDLNVTDLRLLHHWTISASMGFGDKPGDEKQWQVEIPKIAYKHPFLMRGILAISALHLSRILPDEQQNSLLIAAYHQDMALPSYRGIIYDADKNMTDQNCHAVIAFASLTSAHSLACPRPPGSILSSERYSLAEVSEWLHLQRGARRMLTMAGHEIAKGPMAFQLRTVQEPIDTSYNPEDFHLAALESLFRQLEGSSLKQDEEIGIYYTTLALLRESFATPFLPCQTLGVKLSIYMWVDKIPERYLELLSEHKPGALVLLAHLCVLLKKGSRYWYMDGAAERIASTIEDVLEDQWKSWISWPLERIRDIGPKPSEC